MDISFVSGWLVKMVINPLMWLLLLIVFFGGILLILKIRKNRRLMFPVGEIVDLGRGKINFNTDMRAGFFGKKSYLRGLIWRGEEVVKTNFGDRIIYAGTEDFHEVNGKRGFICYRDPLRPGFLFPINKAEMLNKELIASVAPADFTDAAVDIVKDAQNETSDWKDKLIQFGGWALVVVFALIAIIVIVQMVKNGQDKSAEMMLQAGDKGIANCKAICQETLNTVLSSKAGFTGTVSQGSSVVSSAP